jgi:hypothetical protein
MVSILAGSCHEPQVLLSEVRPVVASGKREVAGGDGPPGRFRGDIR